MFSALFRIISWFLLACGVIVAIVDAARSVAAKNLQLTGFGETMEAYLPSMAQRLEAIKTGLGGYYISNWPLANVIDYLNAIPVALLAAGLFLIIYGFASRNREIRHF